MSVDIGLFLVIVLLIIGFVWVFLLRRVQHIPVTQLFEPATFNLLIFVITGFIGVVIIFIYHDQIYFNKVVAVYANEESVVTALILSVQLLFCMAMVSRLNWKSLNRQSVHGANGVNFKDLILLLIILACVLLIAANELSYLIGALSASDQYEVMALRKSASEAGGTYLFKKVVIEGVFWISVIHYVYIRPNSRVFKFLLLFTVLSFLVYFLTSLKKIQFVLFLISILGARYYHGRISVVKMLSLFLVFVLLMFTVYWLLIKNVDIGYMLSPFSEGLIGRLFISEISSLYAHLELFRNPSDQLGFTSVSNGLSSIFGMVKNPRSGEIVMEVVNPHWVKMGIGGTFNTVFIGEAYAGFGLLGAVLSIFYVALYYRLVFMFILKVIPRYMVPIFIYVSINVSIMSGFNDFLYDPFLIMTLFIIFVITCLGRAVKKHV